jgi:tRNA pseudouridine13 synthase
VLRFELPKGSYATTVLREVMKVDVDAPLDGAVSAGPDAADEGSTP